MLLQQYVVHASSLPKFEEISSNLEAKRVLKESVIYPSKFPHLFQVVARSREERHGVIVLDIHYMFSLHAMFPLSSRDSHLT
jgi:hypothetical protein